LKTNDFAGSHHGGRIQLNATRPDDDDDDDDDAADWGGGMSTCCTAGPTVR